MLNFSLVQYNHYGGDYILAILNDLKSTLETGVIYTIYHEYDKTPLAKRGNAFVTIGLNSEETSTKFQNDGERFIKSKANVTITTIMTKNISTSFIYNYVEKNIINTLMYSNTFNVLNVDIHKPEYSKYLDRVQLPIDVTIEYVAKLSE